MKMRWHFRRPGRAYRDLKRTADVQQQEVRRVIAEAERVRVEAVRVRVRVLGRTRSDS